MRHEVGSQYCLLLNTKEAQFKHRQFIPQLEIILGQWWCHQMTQKLQEPENPPKTCRWKWHVRDKTRQYSDNFLLERGPTLSNPLPKLRPTPPREIWTIGWGSVLRQGTASYMGLIELRMESLLFLPCDHIREIFGHLKDVKSDFLHHRHFAKFYHLSSPLTNWPPIDAKAIASLTSATFFASILCICPFQLFYLLSAPTPHNQPGVLLVSVTTNWPTDAIKRMETFTAKDIWSFSGSLRNCFVWDQAFGEGLERKTKSPTAYPGGFSRIIFCCKLPRVVWAGLRAVKVKSGLFSHLTFPWGQIHDHTAGCLMGGW